MWGNRIPPVRAGLDRSSPLHPPSSEWRHEWVKLFWFTDGFSSGSPVSIRPSKKPKFRNSNSSWIRDRNKNQGLTWPPLYIFLNYIFFSSCYFQDVACKDIIKQFHEYENEEVNNQDIIETRVLGLCCSDKTTTDINGIFCKLFMKILSGSQTNSYCIVSMIL